MSCPECSALDIQAASLRRRLDAAERDIAELEAENAGLRSALARAREQLLNQVSRTL